jgi:iron complex outermembrane receptor protein
MFRYIGLLFLVITGFSYSQDCNYTFLGELTDFHDGTPIISATVYIKERDRYTTSDFDGKFKIENLCKGPLTLTISHIGCETKTVSYNINGDTFKAIALEHHIEELSEVSVSGKIQRNVTETAQETVIKSEILSKYSALSLGDALKEVPGVSSINTGNSIVKPMINGMHSSRLLVLNNNVRLQDQEWGIEHAPSIDINSADQISVIKGAGALAFGGDAVGGVIVINPRPTILTDTLYGQTILGGQTNGRGFNFSSSLNKSFKGGWYANAQGSYKQNGDFEAPEYNLSNTGLKSGGFTFKGGKRKFESGFEVFYSYLNNTIGILRAAHIGNITDLVDAINSQQPAVINDFTYDIVSPRQEITHHLVKAQYYKRFKNFGKVNVQYDYQNNQRFEFDVRVGDDRNKPAIDLNLQTHTVLFDVNLDSNQDYNIDFGVMGRYQNNFANPETGVRRLIPDYDKYDFGSYITTSYSVNENLLLDAGIRYDFNRIDALKFYRKSRWEELGYDVDFADIVIEDIGTQLLTNPVFNFHNISASAGIRVDLNEHSYIIGNYSLANRPPNPSELFSEGLHHSAARIELGDLRLGQELSHRVALSYSYTKSNFNILLEGFYNRINDFIYIEPFGVEQTIRGAFPVWNYVQSDSELYGIDLNAAYNITEHLNLRNKSAFIIGNDLGRSRPLIDIPAFTTENTLSYTNSKWNGFSLGLTSQLVLEQTRFPDNNFTVFIPSRNETVLVDISTPPPAYHLMHLYGEMTFNAFKASDIKVALSLNNIFDTQYRSYLNRLRYFADDVGRNILLQIQLNY